MLAINQHCHSQGFNDLLEKTAILRAVRSWLWNLREIACDPGGFR